MERTVTVAGKQGNPFLATMAGGFVRIEDAIRANDVEALRIGVYCASIPGAHGRGKDGHPEFPELDAACKCGDVAAAARAMEAIRQIRAEITSDGGGTTYTFRLTWGQVIDRERAELGAV